MDFVIANWYCVHQHRIPLVDTLSSSGGFLLATMVVLLKLISLHYLGPLTEFLLQMEALSNDNILENLRTDTPIISWGKQVKGTPKSKVSFLQGTT